MVSKSGSNRFRGGYSAYWEPEALQEQDPDTVGNDNQEEGRESFELNASLGADAGGEAHLDLAPGATARAIPFSAAPCNADMSTPLQPPSG